MLSNRANHPLLDEVDQNHLVRTHTHVPASRHSISISLSITQSFNPCMTTQSNLDLNQVVRDHVRNVGLTVVKDLQSKGGMDVSDDDGLRDDLHLLPAGGGKPNVTSDDVVAAMLEVRRCRVHLCRGVVPGVGRVRGGLGGDGTC